MGRGAALDWMKTGKTVDGKLVVRDVGAANQDGARGLWAVRSLCVEVV